LRTNFYNILKSAIFNFQLSTFNLSFAPSAQISSARSAHTLGAEREVLCFSCRPFFARFFRKQKYQSIHFFGDNYFCGTKVDVFCVKFIRKNAKHRKERIF